MSLKVRIRNDIFETGAIQFSRITLQTGLTNKPAEFCVDVSYRCRATCPEENRSGVENFEHCTNE